MIALIDPGDPRLGEAEGEPLILAAIQGIAKTAGPGLARAFWMVTEDVSDRDPRELPPLGVVCLIQGSVLATVAGDAAAREIAGFLEMMGHLPATVDGHLARLLPGALHRRSVLRYAGGPPKEVPTCAPSVMALVDLGIAAGTLPPALREAAYAEQHLRLRRGVVKVFLVPGEDGKPAAGACILLGRGCAVIGDLACLPEKRGRGYGAAALSAAVRGAVEMGKIPLLACQKGMVSFYTGRGFHETGEVWERG